MKKLFLCATLLAVCAISQGQIKYGIKAGANFYKFSGSDAKLGDVSPKFKVGFAGGALVNIPITEMFSLQPEVLYSMEGAKYEANGDKLIYKTDYINIPVLFQYNASGFYGETGPQVGFLASAKATDGSTSTDVKDQLKSINFSWAIGFGYKLQNGFGVGARYNLGLLSVADDSNSKVKLGGFNVGIFYMFGGSK